MYISPAAVFTHLVLREVVINKSNSVRQSWDSCPAQCGLMILQPRIDRGEQFGNGRIHSVLSGESDIWKTSCDEPLKEGNVQSFILGQLMTGYTWSQLLVIT